MAETVPVNNPIDIGEATEKPGIPVYDPNDFNPVPKPTEETATDRAGKAAFGFKPQIPAVNYDYIYSKIMNGLEGPMREEAAAKIDEFKQQRRREAVKEMVNALGRPITMQEFQQIDDALAGKESPNSVIEDNYAHRYMAAVNWKVNTNSPDDIDAWTHEANMFIPKDYRMIREAGEDVLRTREYINTLKQDATDTIGQQTYVGYAADLMKQFVPGYNEYELRNLGGAGILTGGLLGENIESNILTTLSLPWEDRKEKIKTTFEGLKKNNPQMAMRYLELLEGQSRAERYVNNVFSAWDALSSLQVAKGIGTAFRNRATLVGRTTSAVKRMAREIETDAKSATEAAAAAAGDMEAAAEAHIKADLVSGIAKSNPTQQAIDYLQNFFKGKINALFENVGTGNARELVRQIKTRYETAADNIIDRLRGLTTGMHVPESFYSDLIAHYRTNIDRYFPGTGNNILDFSVPFQNEVGKSEWSFNIHYGTNKKVYFDTPEAATGWANMNGIKKDFVVQTVPENLTQTELMTLHTRLLNERDQYLLKAGNPMLSKSTRAESKRLAELAEKKSGHIKNRIDNFGIEGHGAGYYIRVTKPLDLTQPFIRNAISNASKVMGGELRTPDSYLTALVGKLRTPDETLSEFQRRNRGLAVHGPNALMQLAHELGEDLVRLSKGTWPGTTKRQMWKDFEHILTEQQKIPDPVDGVPGYTFRNVAELQYAYMRFVGRLPSEMEVKAYWGQKMLYELDHVLRTISLRNNKSRVGADTHTISAYSRTDKRILSKAFDGTILDSFPKNDGGNILVVGRNVGGWFGADRARQINQLGRTGTALKLLHKEGKIKIVRIYDEYQNPLKDFGGTGDHSIKYVAVPSNQLRTDPLTWHQLPERGGGHFIYNHPFYLKQAIVHREGTAFDPKTGVATKIRNVYKGDATIMGIPVRALGQNVEKHINAFRLLLRDRKLVEAKQYLRDNKVPIDYAEMVSWFKGAKKGQKPWLDIHEPVRLVERGHLIGDIDNDLKFRYTGKDRAGGLAREGNVFFNGTKSGAWSAQRQVSFTGERDSRDLMAMYDIGGRGNPIYKYAPAQLLSPIQAMNRGISSITNSFFMDEYRWTAMEHWLKEAEPYLQLRKNELESSPWSVFNRPQFIKGDREANVRIKQLEIARYQINSLAGMPSENEGVMHAMAQALADMIYKRAGPKFIIDPAWVAANLNDPARFIRSMAFHMTLGFFNLPQYVRQLGTFAIIHSISPRAAAASLLASFVHSWTSINASKEILNGLDKFVSKMYIPGMHNWKPGWFSEAATLARDSGFFVVAGEYAARDDMFSTKIISKGWSRFLDAGTGFFTAGERMVRRSAFYTSYLEFRAAKPLGALTADDKLKIITRARDLNVNMDRAGNAIYQQGLGSVPLQFLTYQMRTAELFLGKRTSWKDKLRMYGVNAALYGAIGGLGISGFPFGDQVKEAAVRQGYNLGDNYIYDTLMQGVPASMLAAATGNWYNINEALGPQGWEPLREAMRGDATIWSLAFGAVGTTAETMWRQSEGLRSMAMSAYKDDQRVFPFVPEDIKDVFDALSSFYHIDQTFMAIMTHRWYSRSGTHLVSDISPLNAIFMFLAGGLAPEQASNVNVMTQALDHRKTAWKEVEKFFIKEWRRGVDSAVAGVNYNPDEAHKHFSRAYTSLHTTGYPKEDWAHLHSLAGKDYETQVERINSEFYTRHVPEEDKSKYRDIYTEQLKRKYGYK